MYPSNCTSSGLLRAWLITLMILGGLSQASFAQCGGFTHVKIANKWDQDIITSKTHSVPVDIYSKVLDCNYSNGTYYLLVEINWKGLFSGDSYSMKGWLNATSYKWRSFDLTWANGKLIGLELVWGGLKILSDEMAKSNSGNTSYSSRSRSSSYPSSSSSNYYKATSRIKRVWAEYGVYQNGKQGMRIHANFDVDYLRGQNCLMSVWFYYQSGTKLKDYDGQYKTPNGQVAVSKSFKPGYDKTVYNDLSVFIPYSQLHCTASGKYKLMYKVGINSGGRTIGSYSSNNNFWYQN